MRASFHPRLINGPFSDPGLFIPFLFEKRAILFDLGELSPLSARDLLKVTHVFVTHTHMDHFIGFDTLLRILLGREKKIHVYGPPDFFSQVEGKLAGYTWNLVDEYRNNFELKVTEVRPERMLTRTYVCRERFSPTKGEEQSPFTGILLKEPAFHIEAAILDHRIPCLGLSLVENFYVNIDKEGLRALGLPVGPWLTRFKKALYDKEDLETDFFVTWEQGGKTIREKVFVLGELAGKIARISPGQKISYITDITGSLENCDKVVDLAKDSDHLFIEAAFLDRDKDTARKKYHLTAKEAGDLAGKAGAKQFTLFHFSPRYSELTEEIKKEAADAFNAHP
ncbi:MAG: MBL fold metallo-hydrolase [Desulfobacteraceae bacterium]|jgi:ribonuclease Z